MSSFSFGTDRIPPIVLITVYAVSADVVVEGTLLNVQNFSFGSNQMEYTLHEQTYMYVHTY
jgi:hypothetical protein